MEKCDCLSHWECIAPPKSATWRCFFVNIACADQYASCRSSDALRVQVVLRSLTNSPASTVVLLFESYDQRAFWT